MGWADIDFASLFLPLQISRGQPATWHLNVRGVLYFVVQHGVVGFLRIVHKLVDVLVNLNRCRNPAIPVLELNVVLAWLLVSRLDLNSIA